MHDFVPVQIIHKQSVERVLKSIHMIVSVCVFYIQKELRVSFPLGGEHETLNFRVRFIYR